MESKEINEILNKTRRTPNISLLPEQVEELVKDLELLEKYKRVMCEPILDIMKKLEQLDTIKSWFIENAEDYTNEEHPNYFIDVFIREDEPIFNIIKETLENGKDNL